jgi:hypothetical protein
MPIKYLDTLTITGGISATADITTTGRILSAGRDLNSVFGTSTVVSLSTISPNSQVTATSGTLGIDPASNLWVKKAGTLTSNWETVFTSTSGQYYANIILQDATGVVLNPGELGTVNGNLVIGDGSTASGNRVGSNSGSLASDEFRDYSDSAEGYSAMQRLSITSSTSAFSATNGFILSSNTPGTVWFTVNSPVLGIFAGTSTGRFFRPLTTILSVRSTTQYARALRWDGTFGPICSGTGNFSILHGDQPTGVYTMTQIPVCVFPCTSTGRLSGTLNRAFFTGPFFGTTTTIPSAVAVDLSGMVGMDSYYVNDSNITRIDVSRIHNFVYLDFRSNKIREVNIPASAYVQNSPMGPYGDAGYWLDVSNNPITTLTAPYGASSIKANSCGLKSFKAGEYSNSVECNGFNPVNSIDFSALGTVNASNGGSFQFNGANMTTNAVDAAFNSFPTTFLQVASAAGDEGIGVVITGTSEPPSANSLFVRNLIVAGGGYVLTN